jgi:hypothetical protein
MLRKAPRESAVSLFLFLFMYEVYRDAMFRIELYRIQYINTVDTMSAKLLLIFLIFELGKVFRLLDTSSNNQAIKLD